MSSKRRCPHNNDADRAAPTAFRSLVCTPAADTLCKAYLNCVDTMFALCEPRNVLRECVNAACERPPPVHTRNEPVMSLWRHMAKREMELMSRPDPGRAQSVPSRSPASYVTIGHISDALSSEHYRGECVRAAAYVNRRAVVHFGIHCGRRSVQNAFGDATLYQVVSSIYFTLFSRVILDECARLWKADAAGRRHVCRDRILRMIIHTFESTYVEYMVRIIRIKGTHSVKDCDDVLTTQVRSCAEDLCEPFALCIQHILQHRRHDPLVLLFVAGEIGAFQKGIERKYKIKMDKENATDVYQFVLSFARRLMVDTQTVSRRDGDRCHQLALNLSVLLKNKESMVSHAPGLRDAGAADGDFFAVCGEQDTTGAADRCRHACIRLLHLGLLQLSVPASLSLMHDQYDRFRFAVMQCMRESSCDAPLTASSGIERRQTETKHVHQNEDVVRYMCMWRYHQYFIRYAAAEAAGTAQEPAREEQLSCSPDSFAHEYVGAPYAVPKVEDDAAAALSRNVMYISRRDAQQSTCEPLSAVPSVACPAPRDRDSLPPVEDRRERTAREIMVEYAHATQFSDMWQLHHPPPKFHLALLDHVPFVHRADGYKVINQFYRKHSAVRSAISFAITLVLWSVVYLIIRYMDGLQGDGV